MNANSAITDDAATEFTGMRHLSPRIQTRGESRGELELATPNSLSELIGSYRYFEEICDEAITRQDDLSRSVVQNLTKISSGPAGPICSGHTETGASATRTPFAQIRSRGALLPKPISSTLPLTRKRFLYSEDVELKHIEQIEQIENEVRILQFHLRSIEENILDFVPGSRREAAQKLHFLAVLMLSGDELEVDHFAYLVDECADVIETPR